MLILPWLLTGTCDYVMIYSQWTVGKWFMSFLVSENLLSNPPVSFFHVTKTLEEKYGDGEAMTYLSHYLAGEPNLGELLGHSRFYSERWCHLLVYITWKLTCQDSNPNVLLQNPSCEFLHDSVSYYVFWFMFRICSRNMIPNNSPIAISWEDHSNRNSTLISISDWWNKVKVVI